MKKSAIATKILIVLNGRQSLTTNQRKKSHSLIPIINTYVMFLLVSMMFMLGASTAVAEVMLVSPSLPESEPRAR